MSKINNVHDKFFKEIFSYVANARDFVQASFPPELVQNMDLDSLQIEEKSYIDARLDETFADLVYSCNYQLHNRTKKKVKLCLLFEHKSRQSSSDVMQVLYYIVSVNMQAFKQKKRPDIVIPIIFYHGQKAWKKRAFHRLFGSTDAFIRKFIPAFDYLLIDLSQFSHEQIDELYKQKDTLRAAILLLKYIQNRQEIIDKIQKIFTFADTLFDNNESENQLKSIYIYLFNNLNEQDTMETLEKLKSTSIRKSKGFVSYADTLIMKGMEKGREEGSTIKSIKDLMIMHKRGCSVDLIQDVTGFNETQINEILSLSKKQPSITAEEIYELKFSE